MQTGTVVKIETQMTMLKKSFLSNPVKWANDLNKVSKAETPVTTDVGKDAQCQSCQGSTHQSSSESPALLVLMAILKKTQLRNAGLAGNIPQCLPGKCKVLHLIPGVKKKNSGWDRKKKNSSTLSVRIVWRVHKD